MQELRETIEKMKGLSDDLIKLHSTEALENICSCLEQCEYEKAREITQKSWDMFEYEYYALLYGKSNFPEKTELILWDLEDLLEKAESILIENLLAEPTPFVGGPAKAELADLSLPPGKRAYPALLRELMKAAKNGE